MGAALGVLVLKPGLSGALSGVNIVGTVLWLLAGSLIFGAGKSQQVDGAYRGLLGHPAARFSFPLVPTLVALIAGSVCFLLVWLGGRLR